MEMELTEAQVSALKRAADITRARIDYRYLLALVFIRSKLGASWEKLTGDEPNLLLNLSKAVSDIAGNDQSLKHMVSYFDYGQFSGVRGASETIEQLVKILDETGFEGSSVMGNAFEWLLRYYALTHAKEGEAYTPREIVELLVRIANPVAGETVYDPAMGYGGFLIYSYMHAIRNCAGCSTSVYGQELSAIANIIATMNMQVHGIKSYSVYMDDTLLFPHTVEGGQLKKFDVVLSNPPWNLYGYDESVLKKGDLVKERFQYGFTSLESADWAWVQHSLASAKQKGGRVGLVMDAECLSRHGTDREIRSRIVDADLLNAVILLPERIFYHTTSTSSIMLFSASKTHNGEVLFINATLEKEPHREARRLNYLSEENINRIVRAYSSFNDINGFAHVAPLDEIRKKDYNINPSSYVIPLSDVEL
jgi:type I restriction enzyme M protein